MSGRLTLEQCRNLKVWGFPQTTQCWWTFCPVAGSETEWTHVWTPDNRNYLPMTYACPDLEELIDWIGQRFESLTYSPSPIRKGKEWLAEALMDQSRLGRYGTTPLDALYRLAESLNVLK